MQGVNTHECTHINTHYNKKCNELKNNSLHLLW